MSVLHISHWVRQWEVFIDVCCGTETVQVTPLRRTLASSPLSECVSCHQQGHAGNKTLLQQKPPVCNWGCQLTDVGHEMVVLVTGTWNVLYICNFVICLITNKWSRVALLFWLKGVVI